MWPSSAPEASPVPTEIWPVPLTTSVPASSCIWPPTAPSGRSATTFRLQLRRGRLRPQPLYILRAARQVGIDKMRGVGLWVEVTVGQSRTHGQPAQKEKKTTWALRDKHCTIRSHHTHSKETESPAHLVGWSSLVRTGAASCVPNRSAQLCGRSQQASLHFPSRAPR